MDTPTRIEIETFEGFNYVIEAGDKDAGNIPLRVGVKGTYPREREAAEDEDESVKVEKDKDFALTLKTRDEKLEKEQAFGQWTYTVSSWTLDSLLKKRGELVKEKEPEEEPAPAEPVDPVEGLLDLPSAS